MTFIHSCNKPQPQSESSTKTIILRYDTVIHEVLSHTIYEHDSSKVMIEHIPDTGKLVQDYFTQRTFTDSLKDSSIEASYSATIWKNSFYNPKFTYKLTRPQTIINQTIVEPYEPHYKVYIGGFLSYNSNLSVGGLLTFENKKDQLFIAGVGHKIFMAGFQTKIHF